MYTIVSHSDVVDKEKRRRIVDVTFTNGVATFVQSFSFTVDTELEQIKKTVKDFLDELNYVPPVIDDFSPTPEEAITTLTAAELAKTAWETDWNKLKLVDELIAAQVLTGLEAQVVTLRDKVKTDFKPSYL